jgi:predicted GIY-YIG superfamily endonuclease
MPALNFVGFKSASRNALAVSGRKTDFPGCYEFIDEERPMYVGISRGVIKRLVQHLNFESHYTASLVYRMAIEKYPHGMKRDQAMKNDQFKVQFWLAQEKLRKTSVAFIEINNDLELYIFEVMAAIHLQTDT